MGFGLILIEEHAGRAVELAYNHPFCPIDDESSIIRHERNLSKIDLLLFDRFNAFSLCLLIHIPDDQANGHFDRSGVGHPSQQAFLHIIFGFGKAVAYKFEGGGFIKILDWKNRFKNSLKPHRFPVFRIHIGL